jgi:hypothetical protein
LIRMLRLVSLLIAISIVSAGATPQPARTGTDRRHTAGRHKPPLVVPAEPWSVCNLEDCTVIWAHAYQTEIQETGVSFKIQRYGEKPLQRFWPDLGIVNVSAWRAPEDLPDDDTLTGVIFTCAFPTGSGRDYIILAHLGKNRWKRVFEGSSDKSGGRHGLEIVDVDGDGYPELVVVPSFRPYYDNDNDPAALEAEIWKWSPGKQTYVKVGQKPYLKRLQRP